MAISALAEKGPLMARKHPRSYPTEFRLNVIDLARAGRTFDELAVEFKISPQTIRNWVKQADLDHGRRGDGLTSAERDELARLRKKTSSSRLSEKSWQKRRPGSLARRIRFHRSLRIRESASGPVAGKNAMSRAGRLDQRLLCVVSAHAIDSCDR